MESSVTERCPWCGSLVSRVKFIEIEAKIREQERKRLAEAESTMRKQLEQKFQRDLETAKRAAAAKEKADSEKRVTNIAAERDRMQEKLKQAEAREATIRKQAQDEADQKLKKQATEQRAILQKDHDQRLLKQQAGFNREREAYQKKMKDMERQLQRKTAGELGDGAEIDLFEELRTAYPDDSFKRIQKGQPGADILHEVRYKGEVCGRIVFDSKNRQQWRHRDVTKLREDQVAAKADHAVLSTTVFPSGKKELCIESGVIVASPPRAVALVELLRRAMIRLHVLGLSKKEREHKTGQLYSYITSETYTQHQQEAEKLTQEVLDLDVTEQREHQNTWRKRGTLATRVKNVLRTIDTEIGAIVEGTRPADDPLDLFAEEIDTEIGAIVGGMGEAAA
jgi:hypothetical protein